MMKRVMEFPMEVKSVGELGYFAGYASIFDYVDSQLDVVTPGSFSRTILQNDGEIKLLWQHDPKEPIGYFTRIEEDEHGLYVEGYLQQEVARGREAYALLKSGAVRGLSIGYNVNDYSIDNLTGVRAIHDLDLHEISLVTFPANDMAKIIQVKSAVGSDLTWEIEEKLSSPNRDLDFLHDVALKNVKEKCGEFMSYLSAMDLKAGYKPDQRRAPAGSSTGGQWVAANDNYREGTFTNGRLNATVRPDPKPVDDDYWEAMDEIDPPLSDFDMENLVLSLFGGAKGLQALFNFIAKQIFRAESGEFKPVNTGSVQNVSSFEEIAKSISNGHAYDQHVIKDKHFPDVNSPQELSKKIKSIMENANDDNIRHLRNGRIAYWDPDSKAVVIYNELDKDKGTIFKTSERFFRKQLK